ncbi:hypothetical protein DRA4_1955 [Lactococcus lactis subsp. lactis bv. diacetylactis]|nr:hypothetical protein DRA4_1955 [Lactococcus lactis subsp. lactis bv. diacetylactis]
MLLSIKKEVSTIRFLSRNMAAPTLANTTPLFWGLMGFHLFSLS